MQLNPARITRAGSDYTSWLEIHELALQGGGSLAAPAGRRRLPASRGRMLGILRMLGKMLSCLKGRRGDQEDDK